MNARECGKQLKTRTCPANLLEQVHGFLRPEKDPDQHDFDSAGMRMLRLQFTLDSTRGREQIGVQSGLDYRGHICSRVHMYLHRQGHEL